MIKLFVNIISLLYLALPVAAQEKSEGIRFFEGTWEEALQKAKEEDKLIFVDCYTVWCGPCAGMAKSIFPLKEVGDFYNSNFICMKIEMEKGRKDLAERYDVVAYPTFLFVTGDGYVAHRGAGAMKADAFIALGKEALKIGHNGNEERFAKGERDEAFLKSYIQQVVDFHQADLAENLLNQLYQEQGHKLLRDKDYWTAFDCCAADINAPLSLAFLKDYKKLCKIHGEFAVAQKVRNLYASIAQTMTLYERQGRKDVFSEAKKEEYFRIMNERKVPNAQLLQQEIEFIVLLRGGQYAEAYTLGEKALANADARTLCNWATLGERLVREGGDIRKKMAVWAERAIKAGLTEEMQEEAKAVQNDLQTSEKATYLGKGKARKTIPMRGYLMK